MSGKLGVLSVRSAGTDEFVDPYPSSNGSGEGTESLHASKLNDFLRESLQMQHLVVLVGSGASYDKGPPTMGDLWKAAIELREYGDLPGELKAQSTENIEVLLSRCDAYLSVHQAGASVDRVAAFRKRAVRYIVEACRQLREDKLDGHVSLLKKLARRRTRDSRLKVFTTNYDLAFEKAAERLGQVAIDGFSYSFPRTFNPRHFSLDIVERGREHDATAFAPGVFQYFKLHGSVNWVRRGEKLGSKVVVQSDDGSADEDFALIYPASSKYQSSFAQPHLELMTHYLAALREPNTCLLVAGFGFNDDHLSEPIIAALRSTPGFRLIVVSPSVEADLRKTEGNWAELDRLARASDVDITFVNAKFDDFVGQIPDLSALPPAEHLARHLKNMLKGSPA